MPTRASPPAGYRTFGELETACRAFCEDVNDLPHRETRRRPVEALSEERTRLHPLPAKAFTIALATTRRVNWDATISVVGVRYSVPHELIDTRVWARFHSDELIVTAVEPAGPVEVARHQRSTPGTPSIQDEHYPPREDKNAKRTPKATSAAEAAFLALGTGAELVDRGRRCWRPTHPGENGRSGRAGQAATAPPTSTRRWARRADGKWAAIGVLDGAGDGLTLIGESPQTANLAATQSVVLSEEAIVFTHRALDRTIVNPRAGRRCHQAGSGLDTGVAARMEEDLALLPPPSLDGSPERNPLAAPDSPN